MEDRYTQRRSGMPLSHNVVALFIAVAAAGLLWAWLSKKATESASAVLSFSPSLAQDVDPGLRSAAKPAIALAESILNDQAIATLAKQARLKSSADAGPPDAGEVGEFRSALKLTEQTPTVLDVQFLDSEPSRAAASANAIAAALAAWTPSQAASPAAAAQPEPATPQQATPEPATPQRVTPPAAPTQNGEGPSQENHPVSAAAPHDRSLPDSLGEISAQLAATDRDMDRLAGEPDAGGSPHRDTQSAYTEYRQQQLLRTQVTAAEKKLADLRAQYAKGDTDPEVKGRLTSIQQALASILRGGQPDAHGFRAAGTSASQLRRERSELSDAIGVVDKERQAIEQTEVAQPAPKEAAQSASDGSSRTPAPPGSAPTAQTSSPNQQTPDQRTPSPADSGTSAPQQQSEHPLSIVRMASPTPPASPLLPILAGLICGLVYLGSAIWAYSRAENDEDYTEEETAYPHRFITPADPVNTDNERVEAANLHATQIEPDDVKADRRQPEFVLFAADDESFASPKAASVADDKNEASTGIREEPAGEDNRPASHEESVPDDRATFRRAALLWDEKGKAPFGIRKRPRAEAGKPASAEEDPLADHLKKSLSQTEIGRMFEGGNQNADGASITENARDREPS